MNWKKMKFFWTDNFRRVRSNLIQLFPGKLKQKPDSHRKGREEEEEGGGWGEELCHNRNSQVYSRTMYNLFTKYEIIYHR